MRKVSPFPVSSLPCTLPQRYFLLLSVILFPNSVGRFKRTTTRIGRVIFALQQKIRNKTKKKKKKFNDRNFVVKQYVKSYYVHYYINLWEKLVSPTQKWNDDSTCSKTKNCRQHALVTYTT